jgi:predicted Zn-dependent peptidase
MLYQYHEFSNGIRLVHRQHRGGVAHLGVIVNTGSRDENVNQQGLAHFIEHLIFKGTNKRTNYQVLSRLENVGADVNAFTTKEDTSVYASVQKKYYQRAAELLANIVFDSTFPLKEIEKEKAVIIDEINSYKDNPAEWILDEFDEMVFKGHPLGKNILGTKEKLKAYTRESILEFYKANYIASRTVIASVADIPFSKVIGFIGKHFSEVTETKPTHNRSTFKEYTPFAENRKYSRYQSHAVIGNIACHAHDNRRITMSLLNNILGGPAMNSRLNIALREKNGIAYNLESNYQPFSDIGLFNIYCGTDDDLMPKAIELIHKEMRKLSENRLSSAAIHTFRRQLKGQLAISTESHQNEMLSMGKNLITYGKVDSVDEIYRRIDLITAQDIQEMANEVFDFSQLSTLVFCKNKNNHL